MANGLSMMLVGCGAMGGALLRGWLAAPGLLDRVLVLTPEEHTVQPFRADPRVTWMPEPQGDIPSAEMVVFAVKPQVMGDVLPRYHDLIQQDTIVLTMAAGLELAYYETCLGKNRQIIRMMPNTPATVGQALCGLLANNAVTPESRCLTQGVTDAVGKTVWVESDDALDRLTAISGCGPAYVFALVEALEAVAIQMGIGEREAALLARQTVVGSAAYLGAATDRTPTDLRVQVTSPGGMTAAGLAVLQGEGALQSLMAQTARAAYERALSLKRGAI